MASARPARALGYAWHGVCTRTLSAAGQTGTHRTHNDTMRHPTPHRHPALLQLSPLAWATLATCAGLLNASGAMAAESSEAPSEVEPVVVSASPRATPLQDAPFAASVVDNRTLRSAGPMVNLSEAMARVPGLVVNNRNNYAQDLQISSRGFGARATFGVRGLRLYTDGIPATMPDGQGQVGHFDLANAQRIEVIRGPFSALYGNAAGGVISLVSQPITERYFESAIDIGSNALYQVRLAGSAPISDTLSMSASASSMHTDGPRDHSAADRHLGNVKAEWRLTQDRIVAQLSHQVLQAQDPLGLNRQQFDADPDQTTPEARQYNTRKNLNQTQVGTSWQHRFTQAGALQESQLVAYAGRRTVTQFQSIAASTQGTNPLTSRHSGGVVDFDRDYMGLDGRLNWRWTNVDLVTGLNAEDQYDARRGYLNYTGPSSSPVYGVKGSQRRDEANSARTREAYAQAEWTFAPEWAATAGLRSGQVTMVSKDNYILGANVNDSGLLRFHYNTPVVGLRWKASPTLTLHAGAGRGFESPTLGEVAYRPDGSGGFNMALKPQTSRHAELGSKWRPSAGVGLDATLFVVNTSNEIGVLSNSGGRSTFQNVGHTQRKGLELAGQWRLHLARCHVPRQLPHLCGHPVHRGHRPCGGRQPHRRHAEAQRLCRTGVAAEARDGSRPGMAGARAHRRQRPQQRLCSRLGRRQRPLDPTLPARRSGQRHRGAGPSGQRGRQALCRQRDRQRRQQPLLRACSGPQRPAVRPLSARLLSAPPHHAQKSGAPRGAVMRPGC